MSGVSSIIDRGFPRLTTRAIYVTGFIDCYEVSQLISEINKMAEQDSRYPIVLMFDCEGVSKKLCLKLYDEIKRHNETYKNADIHGYVVGRCFSTGLVILQACKIRVSVFRASFMLKDNGSVISDCKVDFSGVEDESVKSVILQRSYLALKRYEKLIMDGSIFDREITAMEALQYGFIDRISESF